MNQRISLLWSNRKAALAVTMINIPLCISLAIASGASPLMGLLTGVWWWVIAAIACSSKHNIYGPAWSLAGILLPIAVTYGVHYIPLLAVMGGIVIMVFGALRLTKYITLIPGSALQWFLLGIGLIIGLQQVPSALGLDLNYSLTQAIQNISQTNINALAIFVGAMVVLRATKKRLPSIPGAVVVTVLWVLIGRYIHGWERGVQLLVDVYDNVQFGLFHAVDWSSFGSIIQDMELLKKLLIASVGIGVIAILETLISSKIAAKETRVPYDLHREVYGLGATNIASGIMGGLPISALVVRTGMNITGGATSRLSGWLVGVFTAILALFFFSNALQYLPFAVIAAILVDVSLGMINLSLYHKMRKAEKASILVILLVGILSYLWDPMMGILVGAVMALLMLAKRAMQADLVTNIFRDGSHYRKLPLADYHAIQQSSDIALIKLEGELNYLSIETHIDAMQKLDQTQTIILAFGHTSVMDHDAAEELEHMIAQRQSQNQQVYITGLEDQTLRMMSLTDIFATLQASWHIRDSKSALLDELLG